MTSVAGFKKLVGELFTAKIRVTPTFTKFASMLVSRNMVNLSHTIVSSLS